MAVPNLESILVLTTWGVIMELVHNGSGGLNASSHLRLVTASADSSVHFRAYRCAGCGSLVAFDSLGVDCACLDECYTSDGRPAADR
jgi:hypothetical protein